MNPNTTYALRISVSALDGRSAAQIVTLSAVDIGSAQVSISSTFVRFNPGSILTIFGEIFAKFTVTAEWNITSSSGVFVSINALTPTMQVISKANAMNRIAFPLSIGANTFTAGSLYSFRLTAQKLGNTNINRQTFTEIMLTVNSVPDGGLVSSNPVSGSALETPFAISTSGWATAAENFPLSYAFAYQVSTTSILTMATASKRAFVTATLPAGLAKDNYLVKLQGQAMDIFLSSGFATSTVTVRTSISTNITQLLSTNIAIGFISGDIDLVFQTINNVSYGFNSISLTIFESLFLLFCT